MSQRVAEVAEVARADRAVWSRYRWRGARPSGSVTRQDQRRSPADEHPASTHGVQNGTERQPKRGCDLGVFAGQVVRRQRFETRTQRLRVLCSFRSALSLLGDTILSASSAIFRATPCRPVPKPPSEHRASMAVYSVAVAVRGQGSSSCRSCVRGWVPGQSAAHLVEVLASFCLPMIFARSPISCCRSS